MLTGGGKRLLGSIGPTELVVIFLILLLLFGAQRLPQLARSIGQSGRAFRQGLEGEEDRAPGAGAPGDGPRPESGRKDDSASK
ncbi:MAG: twin-arginine translocase TatA/TatE family subunit [Bacillota bacterium]|nr:twin-arginine translocase TatA/TatE family subunit [Bacillota bacterium]